MSLSESQLDRFNATRREHEIARSRLTISDVSVRLVRIQAFRDVAYKLRAHGQIMAADYVLSLIDDEGGDGE